MDAIQQLADIFAIAATPVPNKSPPALTRKRAELPRVGITPTLRSLSRATHVMEPNFDDHPLPATLFSPHRRSPRLHPATTAHLIPLEASANLIESLDLPNAPSPLPSANAVIHEATRQAMNYRILTEGPDSQP
jgi:hypothetical protein